MVHPAHNPIDATERIAGLRGSRAAAKRGPAARGIAAQATRRAQGHARATRPPRCSLPSRLPGAPRMSAAGTVAEARDH